MARASPCGLTVSFPQPIRYADSAMFHNCSSTACRLLALLRCACVTLLLAACGTDKCDLDRVGTPLRIADLRETASWTPDFDRAWWNDIDRAYVEYDEEVGRIVRASWDPFVRALVASEQTGFPKERRAARAMWESHLRVRRALGDAENQFCAALDAALPDRANPFIELLRARGAFWRESAVWVPHGQRAPGPLEVLAMAGPPLSDAQTAQAAIDGYARLTQIARQLAQRRFELYLDFCDDISDAQNEVAAAQFARESLPAGATEEEFKSADARISAASASIDAASERLNTVMRREVDEEFRLALLREGRVFADAIAEGERSIDYLDRLVAFLYIGVRSHQSLQALRSVAVFVLDRRYPGDEARRERLERAFESYFEAEKDLRWQLHSGSAVSRASAYESLVQLIVPLYGEISAATDFLAEPMEAVAIEVSAGRSNVSESAKKAIAYAEAQNQPLEAEFGLVDATIAQSRSAEVRAVVGSALSPQVARTLATRFRFDVKRTEQFDQFRVNEATRVAESAAMLLERFRDAGRRLERGGSNSVDAASTEARVGDLMREIAMIAAKVRAIDRAANERLLAEAARLAEVSFDDPRILTARLELELLSLLGASADSQESYGIGGVPPEVLVSPFEVVRTMQADDTTREAAEALLFAHADELRAGHQDAARQQLRNFESFLVRIMDRPPEGQLPSDPWYPTLSGSRAIAVRNEVGSEIGRVLGTAAERAFFEQWRALARPAMTPPRARELQLVELFVSGVRLTEKARQETADLRRETSQVLERAAAEREAALRALHSFVSTWMIGASVRSEDDWKAVALRSAEVAWLRSRVADADARALSRCEQLLAHHPAAAELLRELEIPPIQLPTRLAPYIPGYNER